MKNKKMNKRILAVLLTLVTLLGFMPLFAGAADSNEATGYFYGKLTSNDARNIYSTLEKLYENGSLKSGTFTVDLVKEGVLKNQSYAQAALMADFSAARDAFTLDNAGIIYLEADKLTVTQSQSEKGDYVITLGIGREDNYFADGFTAENTASALEAYEAKVEKIAQTANKEYYLDDKIFSAFNSVIASTEYALESYKSVSGTDNAAYVRNPYGALVAGYACCEGYARALKSVLDAMGIENVLVNGTYADENENMPHMWNYVRMDDNQWYLLDTTLQDGLGENAEGTEYFLMPSTDELFKYFQPDGVISVSDNAFNFSYPNVAVNAYERLSDAFAEVEDAPTPELGNNVTYLGMGLFEAQKDGAYIIASFNGTNWYYYERYAQWNALSMGYEYAGFTYDCGTYFTDIFSFPVFAMTEIAPTDNYTGVSDPAFYTYAGDDKYDMSKVGDFINYTKVAPVAVLSKPSNARLEGGKIYDAEVVFTELLTLENSAIPATIDWVSPVTGAEIIENTFNWDGNKTITFKFRTAENYAFTTSYTFNVTGLVGAESLLAPRVFGFSVVNNPVFGCPKIENSVSTAYANTPALIAEDNLAENEWKDANGNVLDLPYKLSLVATEKETTKNMLDEIGDLYQDDQAPVIKDSKTYEISLGLCNNQIAYVTGKRVKVFVPFPEGYTAESNVTFKAYHFGKNGVEEINCVTTEKGIIMMCDAFSPFTIAVIDGAPAEKAVATVSYGNGSFDTDFVKFTDGKATVTATADEGNVISSITVNGKKINVTNAAVTEISLNAEDYADADSVIVEATFVLGEIEINDLPDDNTGSDDNDDSEDNTGSDTPVKPSEKNFIDMILDFFRSIIDFFINLFK